MNHRRPALLSLAMFILVASAAAAQPQPPDSCRPGRTALVLSGGGSTGLAHVGVIRALETFGTRPDMVVGTSIGSIVGAMYASGYSASELDSLVRALPLDGLFRGYEPHLPPPLKRWPPLIVFEQRKGGFTFATSLTRESETNGLLSYWLLRGNVAAHGDFEQLPIPFRAVATDLASMKPVVLSRGDLAQAVRASISIPLAFRPVKIDGRWLADGGLSANIPIEVARELGAERVIVSDVTEHLQADTLDLDLTKNVAKVLTSSLFKQEGDALLWDDILIRPDVDGFSKLDFSLENTSALIERGYAAGIEALSTSSCSVRSTDGDPELTLLSSRGMTDAGDLVLSANAPPHEEDLSRLRSTILESASDDRYEAVWLNPVVAGDSVLLRPHTVAAPRRLLGVGLAYDNDLGVRAWLGALDRRVLGNRAIVGGALAVGRLRQEVELDIRSSRGSRRGPTPVLSIGLAHESIRWFDSSGSEQTSLKVLDLHGYLAAEKQLDEGWVAVLGIEVHAWDEPSRGQSAAGLVAHFARVSESGALALRTDASWTTIYRRFAIEAAWPLRVGSARVTAKGRYGWGQSLPRHLEFTLGGDQGFPGLHIGERRGDREALLRLGASHPLAGSIHLRLDLASGTTAAGGPPVPRGGWLWGAHVGLSLEIGFCPVFVAYGWAEGGRSALFFRIGRWF